MENNGKQHPHQISVEKLKAKLKQLTKRSWGVSMDYRLLKIKQLVTGWVNYYRIGNFKMICREIDKNIQLRIRMCIWKQWKLPHYTRYKALLKLGVAEWKAKTWANYRRTYARCATIFLHVAIPIQLLKKRGAITVEIAPKNKSDRKAVKQTCHFCV